MRINNRQLLKPDRGRAGYWQVPSGLQVVAFSSTHERHATPPSPQVLTLGAMQRAPAQQPCAQEDGVQVHTPSMHSWPASQSSAFSQT